MAKKIELQYIHKIGDPFRVLKGPFKGGPQMFGPAPAGYQYAKGRPPEGYSLEEMQKPLNERLLLVLKEALDAADEAGQALTPAQEAQLLSLRPAIQSHIELGRLAAAKAQLAGLSVPDVFKPTVARMIEEIEKDLSQ